MQNKTKSQIIHEFELLTEQYTLLKDQYDSLIGQKKENEFLPKESFYYFIEHAPVAMAIINLNGKIEYINKKAFDVFGYRITDINHLENWWKNAYPDENYRNKAKEQWLGSVARTLNGDPEVRGNQYLVTCKDGVQKPTFISQVIVAEKILVLFEDLTENFKIKQALYNSEQHYKMISELTTDYVFKIDICSSGKTELEIITDNYQAITGRQNHEARIESWDKIIYPDDYPLVMDLFEKQMASPMSSQIECRSYIRGSQLRWIQVFSRSEWNEEEKRVTSIVGAVKDITERKNFEIQLLEKNQELIKAKEKAEESDKLKTAFLQNMSHEIRTPMNAIMGFSSLIADNYNNREKLEKFTGIINSRCNDLLEIINGILDIARIESGQLPYYPEECDIAMLFGELSLFFKEHQKKTGKENIRFDMLIPDVECDFTLLTDRVKLKQILINLISNAFKFTEKGSIQCGYKVENNQVIFHVSDTGVGIPADKHKLIFKRFMQVCDDKLRNYGGTGLGLSIVKGLVDLMHGNIWLESVPEDPEKMISGKTTFYFSLPLR